MSLFAELIRDPVQLHPLRGAIFETWVVAEAQSNAHVHGTSKWRVPL